MRDTTFDYTVTALKNSAPEASANLDNDVKVSMQNKLSNLLVKTPQQGAQGAINQTPQGFGRTV